MAAKKIETNVDVPICDTRLIHPENVHQGKQKILAMTKAQEMSEFFGILADPNRLRLLSILVHGEMCVCDLAAVLEMSESAVSHQLRALKSMNLVKYRREGRNIHYSLSDSHIVNLYQEVAEHLSE